MSVISKGAAVNGENAIEVVNLNKYYGERHALCDLNFTVKRGEILGFLGPNGAGKTTAMRILTGYMPPSSGTARVAGYDVIKHSLEVRANIGYLPETVPLYLDMTVADYLAFVARLHHVKNVRNAVERAMDLVNIRDRADNTINKLSKGYRQRVGIAQAIAHEPAVLILDEPTVGLDPRQIIEVRELIRNLGKEHTIILSTHILPEVSQTCSRVLIIREGQIVAEDTPQRLGTGMSQSQHIHLQVAHAAPEIAGELEKIQGVLTVRTIGDDAYDIETTLNHDRRSDVAAMAVQRGWGVLELCHVRLSLEDVFLQLTMQEETDLVSEYLDSTEGRISDD
ncbi:MAG: ATP-binding cassette domain-containing protein [Anaerolineae bacterium]|nr:ATP-binding cassette domain-containing protein [Anaerolineae bacterium]